jgi:hypothetical protein
MADSELQQQVEKLHRLTVYGRWLLVLGCWLLIGLASLWAFRNDIALIRQYFTWTALRYALAFNYWPSIGLAFCLAITGAVLVWQSRNIILGISPREKLRLEQQVRKIQAKGPRHPLWRWVVKS